MKSHLFFIVWVLFSSCLGGQKDAIELVYTAVKTYYPNGNIQRIAYQDKAGKLQKMEKLFYSKGGDSLHVHYVDGIMHGEFSAFYANGKLEQKGMYQQGKLNGEFLFYNTDGSLRSKYVYHQGVKELEYSFEEGKCARQAALIVGRGEFHSWVHFDRKGRIIVNQSRFPKVIRRGWDTLDIELIGKPYDDSIFVYFVSDFSPENKLLRKMTFANTRKIRVPILTSDNSGDQLNILIDALERWAANSFDSEEYYIQLNDGETPKKFNMEGIY